MTYGAEIDLLHVVEEIALPAAYGMEPVELATPQIIESSEKALAKIAEEEIGYEHIRVESLPGYPSITILDYVDEQEVDLVVSVAEKVVRRAACPVFTVKSAGKSLVATQRPAASQNVA